MQIRSYQRAFARDRRIYRIDRWTIPIPGGLPLAATAWFVVLALACWCLSALPGASIVAGTLGWPATLIVAPGAGTIALTRAVDEHRTLPTLMADRVRCAVRHRRDAQRRLPEIDRVTHRLVIAADTSLPGSARILGPGLVQLLGAPRIERSRSGMLRISAGEVNSSTPSRLVRLQAGDQLEVVA